MTYVVCRFAHCFPELDEQLPAVALGSEGDFGTANGHIHIASFFTKVTRLREFSCRSEGTPSISQELDIQYNSAVNRISWLQTKRNSPGCTKYLKVTPGSFS